MRRVSGSVREFSPTPWFEVTPVGNTLGREDVVQMASGYTPCANPECMEIAISNDVENPDLCNECEESE
jgi:hypothetical protein